jgi:hypothetical protein
VKCKQPVVTYARLIRAQGLASDISAVVFFYIVNDNPHIGDLDVIRRRQQIALPTPQTQHHNDSGPSEDLQTH